MTIELGETDDSRNVLVEIRSVLPTLRPSERRIAERVLADPAGFASKPIADIAQEADTSQTTLVRFYQRIGYRRLRDLRMDLTREALRQRLEHTDFPAEMSDIGRQDSLSDVVTKVARGETMSISDTAQSLDTVELGKAVELVARSQRIELFGVGGSALVATDLHRKLSRVGRIAQSWPDRHTAWTAAAVLDETAVAIAISHSGKTEDTVEFLRVARSAGAATIAITNFSDSPLARHADIELRTAARESNFRPGALGSRIAQLLIADCIFIGVAQADYERSIDALRATYEAVRRGLAH
ncbi:MAG: MurR/RpiR family transcriptional regulator [Microbacteriaceae bacterium]